ncbi:hypothetical protein MLD38_003916 [Melastoma candidum]|uniref:Uncharacterized protein n=1 Tax=Melastoma candidum TaxID=119954 RepID=A0ACB9S601_9MYRT|nr:hypothetical protein MLD38_003916 [Melastoma candidum]
MCFSSLFGCFRSCKVGGEQSYMLAKDCCMTMRINLDCNSCCRKLTRILQNMKEIETHIIDRSNNRVIVCGRLRPSDVAIKLRKKMNRRVGILEIQELDWGEEQTHMVQDR